MSLNNCIIWQVTHAGKHSFLSTLPRNLPRQLLLLYVVCESKTSVKLVDLVKDSDFVCEISESMADKEAPTGHTRAQPRKVSQHLSN